MKRALTFLLLISGTAALGAQAIRQAGPGPVRDVAPPTGSAVVAGVVLADAATPQPLRRAAVTLNASDGSVSRTAVTDDAGRFSFADLPARRYNLAASKPGFVRMAYGARRPVGAGTAVTVDERQKVTGLELRLPRGGILTGRVMDETGQPAAGVMMRLLQYRVTQGQRTLAPVPMVGLGTEMTDDRGVYRIYGLPAGEYIVAATPRVTIGGEIRAMSESEIRAAIQAAQQPAPRPGAGTGGVYNAPGSQPTAPAAPREYTTVGYAPVYYPGTISAASAAPVTLGPGEERAGVDFQMQLVRTARVEGMVSTPDGIPPQSVQLTLTPSGDDAIAGALPMSLLTRTTPGPDGKFSFPAVGPGQYTLAARATQRPNAGPNQRETATFVRMVGNVGGEAPMVMMGGPNLPTYWDDAQVRVDGNNLSNLALSLQPGLTISGRIQFAGKNMAPPTDLTRARISLLPAQLQLGTMISVGGMASAQVETDGRFTLQGVVPGRYRLEGTVPMEVGTGWQLKSVQVNGRDFLDFPLDVVPGEAITNAVLTFTDVTQEVSGTLQDGTGRPAPDYTIVVFPADKRLWTAPMARRIRTARPGTDGRFTVPNLPAGDYRIAALTDIATGEQTDPAFLEQLVAASVPFSLKDGEKKTQDFRLSGR